VVPIAFLALLVIAQTGSEPTPIHPEGWVTAEDYPAPALRADSEGRVAFRLDVDATGAVTGCSVLTSSGSPVLDVHTCDLLRLRARFEPARDARKNPIASEYSSAIDWTLPDGRPFDVTGLPVIDRTTIDLAVGSDGRITGCTVVELVGAARSARSLSPCDEYPVGSRYTDPTRRGGQPVSGRVRRTVSEVRHYE
jgi:TonB family protein